MSGAGPATIAIVDYGVANLGSICNMLAKLGFGVERVSTPSGIAKATRIILPGVGAFDQGIAALETLGLVEALREKAGDGSARILGICLGMQLLGRSSAEGRQSGLGLVDGASVRFDIPKDGGLKVPHMGWNVLTAKKASELLDGLGEQPRFYFAHSYHFVCADPGDVIATARHGADFAAAIQHGGIFGVQFHPEKSHRFGMQLLRNFGSQ